MRIKGGSSKTKSSRTLSARPANTPTNSTPLRNVSEEPLLITSFVSPSRQPSQNDLSSPSSMGTKRPAEDLEEPSAQSIQKRTKSRKPRKPKSQLTAPHLAPEGVHYTGGSSSTGSLSQVEDDGEKEEGEIDGNFADLFMVDTTPSVIPADVAYIEAALESPTKASGGPMDEEQELRMLMLQEEEDMKTFAEEVAMESESEDEDEESEEENEIAEIHEDPDALKSAIAVKITDDSAAKVTGRYYKEPDLTRSCGLCGEQGHSSRDCTHSQCFTCGLVDGDHEARNCPVTLVCSTCGSRGHYNRNCPTPTAMRSSYGARCSICSSSLHLVANCPSLWRVYDTSGAKPNKQKITYACANDGTTGDHFIDDCLLPRMHPIRHQDPSAFNRLALGANPPAPRTSSSAAKRMTPGGSGASGSAASAKRRGVDNRREEEDADDDWFASRSRGREGEGPNSRGNSSKKSYRGGKFARDSRDYDNGSKSGGRSASRAIPTHVRYASGNEDRYRSSPSQTSRSGGSGKGGGGYGRHNDDYGDSRNSPRSTDYGRGGEENWNERRSSGSGGGSRGGSRGGRGGGSRGGRGDGGSSRNEAPARYSGGYY